MNSEIPLKQPKRLSSLFERDGLAKAFFLAAAFLSFLLSVTLWFTGHRAEGTFVGIWVPSICSAGALILTGRRNG
jgi:hypothetical protein